MSSKSTTYSATDDPRDRSGNGNGERDGSVKLVAELLAAGNGLPPALERAAFGGEAASVIVKSAEGVTTFGGADADPGERTRGWLDSELEAIGSEHSEVNAPLTKLRQRA